MTIKSKYNAAVDKLLARLTSLGYKVTKGSWHYTDVPLAVITPLQTPFQNTGTGIYEFLALLDIGIIIKSVVPEDWTEITDKLWDTVEGILNDPSLMGTVLDIIPIKVTPGEIHESDRIYAGGSIVLGLRMMIP